MSGLWRGKAIPDRGSQDSGRPVAGLLLLAGVAILVGVAVAVTISIDPASTPLGVVGLVGLATTSGTDDDITDLVAKVERLADGEIDVCFECEREDEVGRLYEAVGSLAEVVAEREEEQTESERYRQELYEITSDPDADADEKIDRLLALGCERLDVENGVVTNIDEDTGHYEIERAVGGEFVEVGTEADLMDTFCRKTVTSEDVLGIYDASSEGFGEDPGHETWGISCYLGGKLLVDDAIYGTLCFVDPDPRAEPFSHAEKAFVDLMTRWVSHVLERRVHERELEAERDRFAALVENTTNPVYIKDADGVYQFVNEGVARYFGLDPEAVVDKTDEDLFDPESAADARADDRRILESGEPITREVERVIDGETHVFVDDKYPYRDADGDVVGVMGISQDVTERRARERELETTSARLEALFDHSPDMIYVLDTGGTIVDANQRLCDKLGLDEDELAGTGIWEHDTSFEAEEVRSVLDDMSVGERRRFEGEFQRRDGSSFPIEIHLIHLDLEDEQRFLAITRDVTDRKEREAELQRQAALLDSLFEQVPLNLYLKDEEARHVRTSTPYLREGYDDEEWFEGKTDLDIYPEKLAEETYADDMRVIESGEPVIEREEYDPVDDEWLLTSKVPWRDEDGDIQGLIGVSQYITDRKERERELRETKRQLELALEGTNTGVWEWNVESDELVWNEAQERLVGLDPGDFEGTRAAFEQRVHPEDLPRVREALETAVERDDLYQTEFRMRHEDGHWIWVGARGRIVTDDDGPRRMVGINNDITDRKEREQELARYKDYTDDVLDAVDDVFYVLDDEGNLQRWNDSLAEATGYADEDIETMHALDFFSEDHQERIADAIADVFEEGDVRVQADFLTKDGERIPYEFIASRLEDPDGNQVLTGIGRDISERVEKERQLREREQRLERYKEYTDDVLDAIDDVFYVVGPDGTLQRWNQALVDGTGYTHEEIPEIKPTQFVVDEDEPAILDSIQEVFESGSARTEARVERKDGEVVPYEFVATGLENPEGEPVLVGVGRDISERVERERRLERYHAFTEDVLDAIDDVFYLVDEDWDIQRWNQALVDVTGYSEAEVAEMNARDFFDDEDAARISAALEDIDNRVGDPLEARLETKDGDSIDYEFVAAPLADPEGNQVVAGVGRDITERKRYEQDLERTKDLLQRTQRMAGVGGWELDVRTDPPEQTWTEEMYRIHDLPQGADVDRETILESYHPEDRADVREAIDHSLETGEGYDLEARMDSDGDVQWVRAISDPIHEDGELIKLRGAIQDVTEQKEREAELERTKDLLQQAQELADVGGWEVDLASESPELIWTEEVYRIHELSPEEDVALEDGIEFYHPEDRERIQTAVERAIEDGESYAVEARIVTVEDNERWVRSIGEPVVDGDGEVVGLRGSIQDVTEQKERKQKLEQRSAAMEASVDGMAIVDEDGTYSYVNQAHADVYGYESPDAFLGESWEMCYGDAEAERLVDEVLTELAESGSWRGEAVGRRADGGTFPQELSLTALPDGGTICVVRDITERKEREMALESLHETARGLLTTETESEVAELVVDAAEDVLDLPGVGLYRLDDTANQLAPAAVTSGLESLTGGAPAVRAGTDSVLWNCFATGTRTVYDGTDEGANSQLFGPDADGGLLVPVGDHGVFVLATEDGRVSEDTRRLVETLVATTAAAFDRLESEASLRERDAELEAQNERLKRQIQITDIIRRIDQSLIGADSREEIVTRVCDGLVEADDVAFAWIGSVEPGGSALRPRAWAGADESYLETVSLDVEGDGNEPATLTARTERPTVVENVVDDLNSEAWRSTALSSGYHSVLSVPLAYDEYSQGVLTVYAEEPGVFGDLEQSVFAELGQGIAAAIDAVRTREALYADTLTELTLELGEADDFLSRVAREAGCEIEFEGLAGQSDDASQLFFTTRGVDPETVESVLADTVAVSEFRLISADDDVAQFEAAVTEAVLPARLVRHGASPRSVVATPDGTEVVVEVPTTTDVREFVEMLREAYPSVELAARQDVSRSGGTNQQFVDSLFADLTERQLEVLRTAYFAGFFEWPRRSTGEDVAEMLDVTQPTVNRHLRLGQQRLLAKLFEEEAPAVPA